MNEEKEEKDEIEYLKGMLQIATDRSEFYMMYSKKLEKINKKQQKRIIQFKRRFKNGTI